MLLFFKKFLCAEVLKRQGYDASCDWWGFGIVLFEMLVSNMDCSNLQEQYETGTSPMLSLIFESILGRFNSSHN